MKKILGILTFVALLGAILSPSNLFAKKLSVGYVLVGPKK